MAKTVSVEKSSDREKKWGKIFKALVKLSQNMQKDKEFLEERIKKLQEVIHKMKLEQRVEAGKARTMLGLKEKEAFIFKQRYENVDTLMADFGELCEYLSQKCTEPKDGPDHFSREKGSSQRNRLLQDEVKNLKSKLEEKDSEISALLAQKDFVWNQYNKMESDLTNELRKRTEETENANAKVQVLVKRAEELEYSNQKLRIQMESEKVQMSKEISRLLNKIEALKSGSGSATRILRRCRTEAGASRMDPKNDASHGKDTAEKKNPSTSQVSKKLERTKPSAHKSTGGTAPNKKLGFKLGSSSKRKADGVISVEDAPKLFTSSFKVPKLKSSASPRVV